MLDYFYHTTFKSLSILHENDEILQFICAVAVRS